MNLLNNVIALCHYLLHETSAKKAVLAGIFANPAEKGGVIQEEQVVLHICNFFFFFFFLPEMKQSALRLCSSVSGQDFAQLALVQS